MPLTVLIPTSGLGSRLGELTDYTNKALVRVGNKAILSHIIEQYPADTQFLVMLGHRGELVREYVSLAHPDLRVTYLDLEMQKGNIGLIGAIRAQIDLIGGPFIFHASDTITVLPPQFLSDTVANIVLGYPITGDASQYRTVRPTNGGAVSRILEKGEMNAKGDLIHIGVVRFENFELFKMLIGDGPENEGDLDCFDCDTHVVNAMLSRDTFLLEEVEEWWDTGNVSSLQRAREHYADPTFVLLEKTDQAVYIVGDRVIKFFSDPKMVESRVKRAALIGPAVPEILGSTKHFFAYRKAEGTLARDTMYPARFLRFLDWCEQNIWDERPVENAHSYARNAHTFYWDKTLSRLTAFYQKSGLIDREDRINGEGIPKLSEMLEHFNWGTIVKGFPCVGFHGDLHFSNILECTDGSFKLLDWREGFGDTTDYGDVYYDLGKILHGLIVSHDLVEEGRFKIEIESTPESRVVTFDIVRHHRHVECEDAFKKWLVLHDYSVETVHLMCALIYLNIAALHHYPYDRFLYFLGKRMIFDLLA